MREKERERERERERASERAREGGREGGREGKEERERESELAHKCCRAVGAYMLIVFTARLDSRHAVRLQTLQALARGLPTKDPLREARLYSELSLQV